MCIGDQKRRALVEALLPGENLAELLKDEAPPELSAAEKQLLLAQLMNLHNVEPEHFLQTALNSESFVDSGGLAAWGITPPDPLQEQLTALEAEEAALRQQLESGLLSPAEEQAVRQRLAEISKTRKALKLQQAKRAAASGGGADGGGGAGGRGGVKGSGSGSGAGGFAAFAMEGGGIAGLASVLSTKMAKSRSAQRSVKLRADASRCEAGAQTEDVLPEFLLAQLSELMAKNHLNPHELKDVVDMLLGHKVSQRMIKDGLRRQELSGAMKSAGLSLIAKTRIRKELQVKEHVMMEDLAGQVSPLSSPAGVPKQSFEANYSKMKASAKISRSLQSAFLGSQQKHVNLRKKGLQRQLSVAAGFTGRAGALRQQADDEAAAEAEAHCRDFTCKKWHKQTKNLSGLELMRALFPPVNDYPCAQAMPLSNLKKLIAKIYESVCCEFYVESNVRMRGKVKQKAPLYDYIEDNLILQYGMPSLARKTLLQMIATCHIHYGTEPRVRTFAELSGVVPSRFSIVELCPNEAQDFYFQTLSTLLPARKVADMMCSKRTSHVTIAQAAQHMITIVGADGSAEVEEMLLQELTELATEDTEGAQIVDIDDLLDYAMKKWCQMGSSQKATLLDLFEEHDSNQDGQLSIYEFTDVIRAATPSVSADSIMSLYKRCLEKSAALTASNGNGDGGGGGGGGDDDDDDDAAMDSILPEAFLAVILPHLLTSLQLSMSDRGTE